MERSELVLQERKQEVIREKYNIPKVVELRISKRGEKFSKSPCWHSNNVVIWCVIDIEKKKKKQCAQNFYIAGSGYLCNLIL